MGKGSRNRKNRGNARDKLADFLEKNPECKKALTELINEQCQEAHKKFFETELAVILWVLHEVFGFGHDRAVRFIKLYKKTAKEVTDFYGEDYSDEHSSFFFRYMVKRVLGIDVSAEKLEE